MMAAQAVVPGGAEIIMLIHGVKLVSLLAAARRLHVASAYTKPPGSTSHHRASSCSQCSALQEWLD